ncbi:hypothetical protein B2G88_15475 [Natronolimnobius baerhuensis]|uniref:Uncharacterized protein n=1 Tax=Natronolimnobius baerhuensis TaxID=253108 RepID=A0A202E6Y7_9EURY|nr:hypothetical protein B2G88_15475 [Natronolimnobius baerhuensis]
MTDDAPITDPRWTDLLGDARAIADEYRETDWNTVVVEPLSVFPSERSERFGLAVQVSETEYGLLETLVADETVTFDEAEVYYRATDVEEPREDRRFALVVERDTTNQQAICLPLTYSLSAAQSVFETALEEEELLVHVSARPSTAGDDGAAETETDSAPDETPETEADDAPDAEEWVTFSHGNPSLFLEESDVRAWRGDSKGEA